MLHSEMLAHSIPKTFSNASKSVNCAHISAGSNPGAKLRLSVRSAMLNHADHIEASAVRGSRSVSGKEVLVHCSLIGYSNCLLRALTTAVAVKSFDRHALGVGVAPLMSTTRSNDRRHRYNNHNNDEKHQLTFESD